MALDFSSYLKVDMDSVPKRLPTLPGGHFFADITGWKTGTRNFGEGKQETPVVTILFKITGPDEDVEDPETVPANKVIGKDYELNDPDRRGQIAIRRLAEDTCDLSVKGLELDGVLDALKGCSVRVFSDPQPNKKEEGEFFDRITKVLPAHD